jgi:glutamate dehydrogenase (NADP+)
MQDIWEMVQQRDPGQTEFHQAVQEVLDTAMPVFAKHPEYIPIMKRMVEPERVIIFRVRTRPPHWR